MTTGREKEKIDFKKLFAGLKKPGDEEIVPVAGPPGPYVDKLLIYKPQLRLAMRRGRRFRRYLDRTRFIERITRVFVGLYEMHNRPKNAAEYICNHISPRRFLPIKQRILVFYAERENMIRYVEGLEDENARLRHRLWRYEPLYLDNQEEEEGEERELALQRMQMNKNGDETLGEDEYENEENEDYE